MSTAVLVVKMAAHISIYIFLAIEIATILLFYTLSEDRFETYFGKYIEKYISICEKELDEKTLCRGLGGSFLVVENPYYNRI